MRNAETTKRHIITTSANLFNTQGYKATSISDITDATGFTKGAIYRHFENKQDLENQALLELSNNMFEGMGASIKAANTFETKFEAVFSFFENYMETPLYDGGCPLLNAAIEADDANTAMRAYVLGMLDKFKGAITTLIVNGQKNNQVKADVNTQFYSNIIIATLEGSIMMSRLEKSVSPISDAIKHLRSVISEISNSTTK